ncbi:phospholipase D-like domain-containing protein [Variovorax terrae]|uniref:Phospholipase D-like domain-containing protein n=1 Tax=Variovorax terrae TaxID=2923278 RepID=A0A9X1VYI9_9BURK|nr:phospholipase D-like domain-containing protein [Variovorax terrae]MCJ0764357.1 phospholipase D-like domain-containing protein [Variovorax terrae]
MPVLAHFAIVLASLLVYAVSTHTSGQRRHPSAALAWVLTITLLPYVGLPLYLVLGTRKFVRPARRPVPPSNAPQDSPRGCSIATLEGMGLAPPTANQRICFHDDGPAAWDELASLIGSAQTQLDICTYVLGHDALGRRVGRLLEARAAAGVRVRLLLDAVGSWRTPSAQVRRLRAAGVQVHWFMPLLRNPLRGRVNLRNHRKLAIADGQRLWSGGRNLAAEYFNGHGHQAPWVDLSFTLEGPLATQAQDLFDDHWRHSRGPDSADGSPLPAAAAPREAAPAAADGPQHRAQLVPSGPDQAEDTVHDLLLTALFRARHRVQAVTPYFVPDDSLLTALCLAARRGVQVELVVPAHSNHRLADIARSRALRDLAAAGGQLRLAPGMVHAKAVVVDDTLALCGSLNLDSRSLFLNFEMMVAFYAPDDIAAVTRWIDHHFHHLPCDEPRRPSLRRDIAEGLVRWLGFQI